jgi:RIO-like serine/threonine protein kinase
MNDEITEITNLEFNLLKACFMFVESGNISFEAINNYHNLDEEEFEEALIDLKGKGF